MLRLFQQLIVQLIDKLDDDIINIDKRTCSHESHLLCIGITFAKQSDGSFLLADFKLKIRTDLIDSSTLPLK